MDSYIKSSVFTKFYKAVNEKSLSMNLFYRFVKMRKYHIANLLARRFDYKSYLEICTPTTGLTYSMIDRSTFSRCLRLMYSVPDNFSDVQTVDFSTESKSPEYLMNTITSSGEKFDLVFVDPYHTYYASLRDIQFALSVINDNGTVVVHDCNPPNQHCTSPEFIPGEWCGLTYTAFLDVVMSREDIYYCTVDTDYGCGIITRLYYMESSVPSYPGDSLVKSWFSLPFSEKYNFFDKHRSHLLRLVTPQQFLKQLINK